MTDKQKIRELEKRVRDLEARPQLPAIIVFPAVQPVPVEPFHPFIPTYPVPYQPWWTGQPYIGDPLPGHYPTITIDVTSGVN